MVNLHINGESREIVVKPSDTLLHVLREHLGLTGAKSGCETGDCGSCTVLINGEPIHSCLTLAIETNELEILTIEGLHHSPIQEEFISHSAFQCGFCTPGFIVNSHALFQRFPEATDEIIDEWMQSNLCRCTGYKEIQAAIKSAISKNRES